MQAHLHFRVADLDAAEAVVLSLGGRRLDHQPDPAARASSPTRPATRSACAIDRAGYIVSDMTDDEETGLPGFRELALRRQALLDTMVARRRAAGLSQGEVAARMGTSQPAVARLEAGQVDARISTLQRYADAVGAPLHLGLEQPRQGR
jgi:DNA-binding XRE family transcriptional regulator